MIWQRVNFMNKIVVLDGFTENPGDLSWAGFEEFGELTVYDRSPKEEIIKRIGDANIVYTNKTLLGKKELNACPNIKFIGLLSTGYNVVDIGLAKEKGIPVANIPSYGTAAVAQFAIALLLEICQQVGHHNRAVHSGRWENSIDFCFWDTPLIELDGKTMGIVGYGRIGKATGKIAQAMGMKILAYSPRQKPGTEADFAHYVELEELYGKSDVISLHCPLFPETEGFINKNSIAKMKDGVIILNNGRGGLINEKDLAAALNSGKVYAAGLDVVSVEPILGTNPLLKAKNCFITPHISWASKESRKRLMDMAVENLAMYLKGTPQNIVNP